jgi:hypothetical protein
MEYSPNEHRPLRGYLALMGGYAVMTGTLAGLAYARRRRLPKLSVSDLVLLGVATHKISRLVAKDVVTSPLRAPFVEYVESAGDVESAGEAEINERPRGTGLQKSIGELISCPFCMAVWVATGLAGTWVLAPRLARLVAGTATAVATADFLHLKYDAAKRKVS